MRAILPKEEEGVPVKRKACIACSMRKVKCDRKLPCKTCISWNWQCRYPESRRRCRRKTGAVAESSVSQHGNVEERVEGIETVLHAAETVSGGLNTLDDTGPGQQDESVHERLDRIEARLKYLEYERAAEIREWARQPRPSALDCRQIDVTTRCYTLLQASPATLQMCWSAFRQNVDPLVKILHLPTAWSVISIAAAELKSLKDGQLSMVFAIMGACLSSMPELVVEQQFKMTKKTTVATFMGAADHALSKTNLTISEDLNALQAFVLCLSMQRFSADARQVWALTGLARRLGQCPASASPFEREMRRRLVWELWTLDQRACIDFGHDAESSQIFSVPEPPSNIRDEDLYPSMTDMPEPHAGWTEVSFSLMQTETGRAALQAEAQPDVDGKLKVIDACEATIRDKYTRYCDGSNPVHWLAQHVASVLILELRLKVIGQRTTTGPGRNMLRQQLFFAALDVLEIPHRLEREPDALRWSWLLQAYMQFVPLRFVLDELCYREPSESTNFAWSVVDKAWERWKGAKVSKENVELCRTLKERADRVRKSSAADNTLLWESSDSSDDSTPYLDFLGESAGGLHFDLDDTDPCEIEW